MLLCCLEAGNESVSFLVYFKGVFCSAGAGHFDTDSELII